MTNPDTQNMIDLVERQTGYRVMVDVISGIHDHAQMISARPEAPAHMIRVNADHRQRADYKRGVHSAFIKAQFGHERASSSHFLIC
jgi:hypothetical protein